MLSWFCLAFLFKSDPNQRGVYISQSDTLACVGFNYPVPSNHSHPEEITAVEDLDYILKGSLQRLGSAKPVKCDGNRHAVIDGGMLETLRRAAGARKKAHRPPHSGCFLFPGVSDSVYLKSFLFVSV